MQNLILKMLSVIKTFMAIKAMVTLFVFEKNDIEQKLNSDVKRVITL